MRIWHIHPAYLDDKRLGAYNYELHTIRSVIVRKVNGWNTIIDPFRHSLGYLKERHDICADEMEYRAVRKGNKLKKHKSLFSIDGLHKNYFKNGFFPSKKHMIQDVKDLRQKWENERYYFGCGYFDLKELETLYDINDFSLPIDEYKAIIEETKEIVKANKIWFDNYKRKYPKSRVADRIKEFFKHEWKT